MEVKEARDKAFYIAVIRSIAVTLLPWVVFILDRGFSLHLARFGLTPLSLQGVPGIFTLPLLHGDLDHLLSNTLPLFLLLFGLFFFYKKEAWGMLLALWLISGLLTWLMGRRETTHVGASGLVYALAAFHFVSGIIKKVPQQMAFALLVAFLYGGFVWAFFPSLFHGSSISWEGHLSGLLCGIALAFNFRQSGPKPPTSPFLEDEDEEEEAYWEELSQEVEDETPK